MSKCCNNKNDKKIETSINLLRALSEPNRLRILCVLLHERICVCKLAKRLDIAQNLLSHHLKVLYEIRLLQKKREKNQFFYYIKKSKGKDIKRLFKFLNIS